MDEYYAKYTGNNAANGASDTDFESPEPDTTSSNNVVKFLEEQQDLNTHNEDDFRTVLQMWEKNRNCPLCNHIYKSSDDFLAHSAMHYPGAVGPERAGGRPTPSANNLTLFKSGGADYAHNTTARPTGFSDLPTALRPLSRASATSSGTSLPNSPNSVDIGGPTQIQIYNDFHQNSRPPPPPYGSHLPSPTPSSAGSGYLLGRPSGSEVPSPAGSGYLLGMPSGSEVHSPAGSGYLLGMPSGSEVSSPATTISNPTVNYWGYQHQNSFYNYPTSTHAVATSYEMPMAYQGFVCQRCGMTFGNNFSNENYDLLVKHCQFNCLANTFQYPPISAHHTSPPSSHHQDQTLAEASKTVKCKSNCDCSGEAHKTNNKTGRPLQTRKRKQVSEKENIDSETLAKYKTLEWEERTGYWCQKCSIKFTSSELLIDHMSKKDVHAK